MAERITYSADFKKKMIEFYKDNPEAKHKQAEEHAKGLGLGYETISKNMHTQLRKEARGPVEVAKEIYVKEKTGSLYKKLESGKDGDRVAIYELKRRGRIQVRLIEEKEK
jgi:hypothetical protein